MKSTMALSIGAAFVLGGLAAGAAFMTPKLSWPGVGATGDPRAFAEIAWPFPADLWGRGKAYRCTQADCGAEMHVYLRAKTGLCDCTTGVASDEDLERVSDILLLGDHFQGRGQGRPIAVGKMKGWSRPYEVRGTGRPPAASVVAAAFHDRCDMVAAMAHIRAADPVRWEPLVVQFLNSDTVFRWTERTLGL